MQIFIKDIILVSVALFVVQVIIYIYLMLTARTKQERIRLTRKSIYNIIIVGLIVLVGFAIIRLIGVIF